MQIGRSCRVGFVLLALWGASPLLAQVIRLPAVMPAQELYPGQLVSHPGSAAQVLQAPAGWPHPTSRNVRPTPGRGCSRS